MADDEFKWRTNFNPAKAILWTFMAGLFVGFVLGKIAH